MFLFEIFLKLGFSLSRCLQFTQVRFRRIQSRNPSDPHYARKAMIEACKPIMPAQEKICGLNKTTTKLEFEPHPYNALRAKKLRVEFEESRMILFYHRNPAKAEDERLIHNMLFKKQFFLKRGYNNETLRLAIKGSRFETAYPFTESTNGLVVSPTADLKTLLRMSRRMPQYILLAGIVDGAFLSREQLQWMATIPDISAVQAQTCGILSYHASNLSRNLTSHTERLSRLLTSHSGEDSVSPSEQQDPPPPQNEDAPAAAPPKQEEDVAPTEKKE